MTDERPIILRKELFGLTATDDHSEAAINAVRLGDVVEVKFKRPRNLQMHRLFWKLMQTVYENQSHYKSADEVCTAFKFACGLTDKIKTKRGIIEVPRSISFAKLGQGEFKTFFDSAIKFCVEEVIPGMGSEELEREVLELVA